MDDLISRAAAIKAICEDGTKLEREGRYILLMASRKQRDADILSALPTVDAVPVRHGRWETVEDWDGDEHYRCSECGAEFVLIDGTPNDNDYLYCPHCGARMDGDHEAD